MYIQQNKPTFGTLYRGGTIKTILSKGASKEFKSELNATERAIRKNNLHKKENVDIILGYREQEGFYGIISSKKYGTPMNPSNECKIPKGQKITEFFTQWVDAWDEAYSPEELRKFRELMSFVKNGFKSG